jgi:2-phospho-L-lactate guanylyltransferase
VRQQGFRVLIPVQRLDVALPRMKVAAPQRRDLALAFARDTVDATLKCSEVSDVVVVTEDSAVADAFVGFSVTVTRPVDQCSIGSAARLTA